MEKLVAYKRMPLWNKQTMPEAVQQKHNTKVGTWGKITVLKGALKFIELTEEGEVLAEHLFEAGADNPMAQPQAWHRVEAATDDVEWYLEFYCKPEDYFAKKYNTNPVHSEVLEAMQTVKQGKALDLGCGQGRNSLFLAQQDFDVTAVDQNGLALEILQSIVEQEDLDMPVGLYDINSASIEQEYGFYRFNSCSHVSTSGPHSSYYSKYAGENQCWRLQPYRLCHGHGGLSLLG